ncbi:regulatory protein RecX [Chloroflexota bacterium]
MKITAIHAGKSQGKRLNIFLDGKFAFSLETGVALREGLQVDQGLSASKIETLTKSDYFYRCFNAALLYLGYRPRSEYEIRMRLQRRGFDDNTVEAVIAKLKEQGLVDDMAFAQFWKDNRQSFSPRSRWLTRSELKQKGVANGIIDQVIDAVDDADSAYRAAVSKSRVLPVSDYQGFRHRLGDYLKRRGFGYQVINQTIERIWEEQV